jgi:hypothetical protein
VQARTDIFNNEVERWGIDWCIGCANRAKALMGLQATAALLTSLIVIARAVGSLGGGSG